MFWPKMTGLLHDRSHWLSFRARQVLCLVGWGSTATIVLGVWRALQPPSLPTRGSLVRIKHYILCTLCIYSTT